jgi:5-methylcytosine-specific restriction protein A
MRERGKNPEYRRIITGKRWGKLRGLKMLKNAIDNGGFCEQCVKNYFTGGPRPRKATEVHHIIPIESAHTREEMEALAYDESNLMALCIECHHELHRQLWKARFNKEQRQLDKARKKEAMENDINDFINGIKNGI